MTAPASYSHISHISHISQISHIGAAALAAHSGRAWLTGPDTARRSRLIAGLGCTARPAPG